MVKIMENPIKMDDFPSANESLQEKGPDPREEVRPSPLLGGSSHLVSS